ncbi:hypothetical protein AAMO2058_001467300 [Amorphochlora amoebiformis]
MGNLGNNDDLATMEWEARFVLRNLTYLWDILMLNYVLYLLNIANQTIAMKSSKLTHNLPKLLQYIYAGLGGFIIIMHIIPLSVCLATDEEKYEGIRLSVITFGAFIMGGVSIYFAANLKRKLWEKRPNQISSKASKRNNACKTVPKNLNKRMARQ